MAKATTLKLVIILFFSMMAFCIFLLIKINIISMQLDELKMTQPSHVEKISVIESEPFHIDKNKLDDALIRLDRVEKNIAKLTALPTYSPSSQTVVQQSEQLQSVPEGHMPEKEFQKGRMQWQQKYADGMFDDADKKSLVMAQFLADNYDFDIQKQQQIKSIMQTHFVEFAYAISDTATFPSFESFSKQVDFLNRQKMNKLTSVLSEQEMNAFNSVDWAQIFKSNDLH
ncbi:hypothetical protein [Pseudoalteromonas piscicida]